MGNKSSLQILPEIEYLPITQRIIDNYPIYLCEKENSNFFLSDITYTIPAFYFLRINKYNTKLVDIINHLYLEKKLLFKIDPIFEYMDIRLEFTLEEYINKCIDFNFNIIDFNIPFLPVTHK